MKLCKIVAWCTLFLLNICVTYADKDKELPEIRQYVDSLVAKGYSIVNDKNLSAEDKVTKSEELIKANLHFDWMALYVLGRYKKTITPDKLKEFTDVYKRFVTTIYAELTRSYKGEKTKINKIIQIDDYLFIVSTEMIKPDSEHIKLDYMVHKLANGSKNSYKVADIITEGVSILNSQQAEFGSILSTNGIDALIADLKSKIDRKKQKVKI